MQKKKEKIKNIQAMYKTFQSKNNFLNINQKYYIIQNSLRIINSKRIVQQKKNILSCLSIHMQIYMTKLREIHRKKIKLVSQYIINKLRVKIVYMEHNKIWNRVYPFFLRLLAAKRNDKIGKKAKSEIMGEKYSRSLKIIQMNLLTKKIKERKEKIKYIFNYSSTKILSKYYIDMIKNILIIQRYMNVKINKKKIIEKLNNDYFFDDSKDLLTAENKDAVETLFPCALDTENTILDTQGNIKNVNNNLRNKSSIRNKDNLLMNTLKSNDYHGLTISDNKTPNMTTLDKTRTGKNGKYNNNIFQDKAMQQSNNTIGYNNRGYLKKNLPKTYIPQNENYLNAQFPKKQKLNNMNYHQYLNTLQNKKNNLKYELIPKYYNFKQATITVFAKVLDIDIINDSNEVEDKSWSEEYINIYKTCLKNNAPIQKIYVGNCHSMVLNSEGKVFTWGWNNYGQCGTFSESTKQNYILPEFKKAHDRKYPQLPILNYKSSNDILPIQNIDDILISENFSIILTEKGNAISFGKNTNGELGLSHKKEVKNAQLITKFKNKVKILKTTGNTNLLLTKNNELFIWSVSKKIALQKPTMVYLPKRIQIESISTGKNFAILLTNNGICYGCGSNEIGELGITQTKYCVTPVEIKELMKFRERIIQVKCGYKHTICLSENGKCYTWGNNSYGQLGHNNNGSNLPVPIFVEENKEKIRIIQVAAGFRASFFLSYNRNVYYCGKINSMKNSSTPVKFDIIEKNVEISNEKEFSVVRILCSYSLYKSVFYASIADVRNLYSKFKSQQRINEVLDILAENWINDKKYPPFIPEIAKFFSANFMRMEV